MTNTLPHTDWGKKILFFFWPKLQSIGKRSQPGTGGGQSWAGCADKADDKGITCCTLGSIKQKGLLWETWRPRKGINLKHLIIIKKKVTMRPFSGGSGPAGHSRGPLLSNSFSLILELVGSEIGTVANPDQSQVAFYGSHPNSSWFYCLKF